MERWPAVGVEWDNANEAKCRKHGLSIAEIEHVLMRQEALIVSDVRNSRVEARFIAIGRTPSGRHALVVFTPREQAQGWFLRPISARYMHAKEVKRYEEEISRLED